MQLNMSDGSVLNLVLAPGAVALEGTKDGREETLTVWPGTLEMDELSMMLAETALHGQDQPYQMLKAHFATDIGPTARSGRGSGKVITLDSVRLLQPSGGEVVKAALPDRLENAAE